MATTPAQRIEQYGKLKSERQQYDQTFQDVADYIRPLRSDFLANRMPGARKNQKIFDSTPLLAADNFAAGIFGQMTNPATNWLAIKLQDEDLNEYDPVKVWLYDVGQRILQSFAPQVSRFYSIVPALYADVACFGTGIFYSEEVPGSIRINDSVRSLAECVIAEDAYGEVDTVYRCFSFTGRQALEHFPEGLHEQTVKRAQKEPHGLIKFIHCVGPNDDYVAGNTLDKTKRPWSSEYIEEETKHLVSQGGYYEMPYHVPRWSQAAGETYGRGLGEQVLPDAKMLMQQQRTLLEAAQKISNPPLAAPDEGVIKAARTWPGGITYGAIDQNGVQLLRPLMTGGDTGITFEMIQRTQNAIKDGFYFSLMQTIGSPNMTAAEWLGRQEEKLRLLGPNLGRIQGEFLSPLIVRRFGILSRAGQLPPAPEEMQGQALKIEYVSPLAKMQKSGEAQAVIRYLGVATSIAPIDPSVMDTIDLDEAMRAVGDGYAVPPKVERGPEAIKQIRDQRAQQQQMQMGLAAAEQGGKAVKSFAGASKDMAQAQPDGGQGSPADVGKALLQLRGALRNGKAA